MVFTPDEHDGGVLPVMRASAEIEASSEATYGTGDI